MFRILLNLARNAGIVGATELKIDIWRAGDTGLGLAIVRDLAVALGGNLKLTSSNQDGSEFRLQLPKQIFLN